MSKFISCIMLYQKYDLDQITILFLDANKLLARKVNKTWCCNCTKIVAYPFEVTFISSITEQNSLWYPMLYFSPCMSSLWNREVFPSCLCKMYFISTKRKVTTVDYCWKWCTLQYWCVYSHIFQSDSNAKSFFICSVLELFTFHYG